MSDFHHGVQVVDKDQSRRPRISAASSPTHFISSFFDAIVEKWTYLNAVLFPHSLQRTTDYSLQYFNLRFILVSMVDK